MEQSTNEFDRKSSRKLEFDTYEVPHSPTNTQEHKEKERSDHESDSDQNTMSNLLRDTDVPSEIIPKVGMEFQSETEAFKFYNRYANVIGFSVRKSKGHHDSEKNCLDRIFCCSREGKRQVDKRRSNVKCPRRETRCGCLAMMKVNARHTGKLQVEKFISEHTHVLASPTKRNFLRSQRGIDPAQAAELEVATQSGIAPKSAVGFMARKVGGLDNLGFIPSDYSNYLRSRRTERMKVGDIGGVLEYLQDMQCEDPNFSYSIQVDIDDLITNVFWADGRMKSDFESFGDVVCFDTTYRKHKDGRPLALFVGVNHHRQSIIFGAALLYDETCETFMWLFDIFAKVMSGKKSKTILTDQDAAMAKALNLQWPDTFHRLCVWHMFQNAAKHLSGTFDGFKTFSDDFSNCVYDYDEEQDFLDAWAHMLEKYGLQNNSWLQKQFDIKEKWALVYGKQQFCADMTTTQRSESMNSQIKRYIRYDNDLTQFFDHFQRLLDDRRFAESEADFKNSQSEPSLRHPVEILKHAGSVYTPTIFKLFDDQVWATFDCSLHNIGVSGDIMSYEIAPPGKNPRHHTVTFDSSNSTIICSCKKFEFVGILCSHALKVLLHHNIRRVPDQYILKRWTKDAKVRGLTCSDVSYKSSDNAKNVGKRYKALLQAYSHLAARAALIEDSFDDAMADCEVTLNKVELKLKKCSAAKQCTNDASMKEKKLQDEESERPHDQCQNIRGIKRFQKQKLDNTSQRKKSALEKATTKKRRNSKKIDETTSTSRKTKAKKQTGEEPNHNNCNLYSNDSQIQSSQTIIGSNCIPSQNISHCIPDPSQNINYMWGPSQVTQDVNYVQPINLNILNPFIQPPHQFNSVAYAGQMNLYDNFGMSQLQMDQQSQKENK